MESNRQNSYKSVDTRKKTRAKCPRISLISNSLGTVFSLTGTVQIWLLDIPELNAWVTPNGAN